MDVAALACQGQPHATNNAGTIVASDGEEMRSQNPQPEALPISSREGPPRRCRMDGGAHGSGAPSGERNGNYRHGFYTADVISATDSPQAIDTI